MRPEGLRLNRSELRKILGNNEQRDVTHIQQNFSRFQRVGDCKACGTDVAKHLQQEQKLRNRCCFERLGFYSQAHLQHRRECR